MQIKTLSTVEVLATIDGGGTLEELREAIQKVSIAVGQSKNKNAKGKITLELTFARLGESQVAVNDKVKVALPPICKDDTLFFTTQDGGLSRNDTRQGSFEGLERSEVD